ncbi:hypothetical protein KY317_00985 [Candidatus Woesearchaeota archaeon]|nr:hypothetical protein [Candidatus Woesearchaeota archaeon]
MKISGKIVEDVVSKVAGKDVVPLVKILKNRKNVSEFKLADSLKQEVNITRNMLYRLYNSNLVSFMRKKDKKKGWYIYYWTFDMKQVKYLAVSLKRKRLEQLKERLQREEEGQFYMCPNKCMRLDFDQAMNFQFKCPECGHLVNLEDNRKLIESIKSEISEIKKDLAEADKVIKKNAEKPKKVVKKKGRKKTVKKKVIKKKAKKKHIKKMPKRKIKKLGKKSKKKNKKGRKKASKKRTRR